MLLCTLRSIEWLQGIAFSLMKMEVITCLRYVGTQQHGVTNRGVFATQQPGWSTFRSIVFEPWQLVRVLPSELMLTGGIGTERMGEGQLQFKTRRCGRRLRMIRAFCLNRAVITSTVDRSLLLKPVSRDWNRYYVIINEPQWCVDVRTDAIRTFFLLQTTKHDSFSSLLDWTQEISLWTWFSP